MNLSRRKFCQFSILGALGTLLFPSRAMASTASRCALGGKCRVEVLRCQCFEDLQGRYLDDPEAGPCTCFCVGDVLEITPANLDRFRNPKHLCPRAWRALEPYIMAALQAGETTECAPAVNATQAVVSCPDGTRPVIFKVTAL